MYSQNLIVGLGVCCPVVAADIGESGFGFWRITLLVFSFWLA